jgi:hypothetical protein
MMRRSCSTFVMPALISSRRTCLTQIAWLLGSWRSLRSTNAARFQPETKQALAAAKARGTKLGNPANLTTARAALGRRMGNAANTARAKQRLIDLEPVIRSIRDEGMTSLSRIAIEQRTSHSGCSRGQMGARPSFPCPGTDEPRRRYRKSAQLGASKSSVLIRTNRGRSRR